MGIKDIVRDKIFASSDALTRIYVAACRAKASRHPMATLFKPTRRPIVSNDGRKSGRFLFDLTSLALNGGALGGIPRFTRNMFAEWYKSPPSGFETIPISLDEDLRYYRVVRPEGLVDNVMAARPCQLGDELRVAPGDVYFCSWLDSTRMLPLRQLYREWRRSGVKTYFTIHTYDIYSSFSQMSQRISRMMHDMCIDDCDGLIAISRWTTDIIIDYIGKRGKCAPGFSLGSTICLGSDLKKTSVSDADHRRRNDPTKTFLMVGTLDWRKGHVQAADAFDILWKEGHDVKLVIIGRCADDSIRQRLLGDPEHGSRLIYLEGASDDVLLEHYKSADVLLCASHFDNHNMPMIEAAQFGMPVIARDFSVFREIAGENAFYFDSFEPQGLADAIKEWLALDMQGRAPSSDGIKLYTWAECAKEWEKMIFGGEWYWQDGQYCDRT